MRRACSCAIRTLRASFVLSAALFWRARYSGLRMKILGILNITSDSFSDGGNYLEPGRRWRMARR